MMAMQVFDVRIERRRVRVQRVVACDADQARRAAAILLRQGDRVLAASPAAQAARVGWSETDGRAALDHILCRVFLDLDGQAAWVRDWVAAGLADAVRRDEINKALSLAGLRIREDGALAVASAASVPTMGEWCADTRFAGSHLLSALDAIPGTIRKVLTLGGIPSRVVIIPASEVQQ